MPLVPDELPEPLALTIRVLALTVIGHHSVPRAAGDDGLAIGRKTGGGMLESKNGQAVGRGNGNYRLPTLFDVETIAPLVDLQRPFTVGLAGAQESLSTGTIQTLQVGQRALSAWQRHCVLEEIASVGTGALVRASTPLPPADLPPVSREPHGKNRPPLPDKLQRLAIRAKAWLASPQIPNVDFIVGVPGGRRPAPVRADRRGRNGIVMARIGNDRLPARNVVDMAATPIRDAGYTC